MSTESASSEPVSPAQVAALLLSVDRSVLDSAIAAAATVNRPAGIGLLSARTTPELYTRLGIGKVQQVFQLLG